VVTEEEAVIEEAEASTREVAEAKPKLKLKPPLMNE